MALEELETNVKPSRCKNEPKLKLDAVWKYLLRDFRHFFYQWFMKNPIAKGKRHWNEEKLISKVAEFMKDILHLQDSFSTSPRYQASMLILLLTTRVDRGTPDRLKPYLTESVKNDFSNIFKTR